MNSFRYHFIKVFSIAALLLASLPNSASANQEYRIYFIGNSLSRGLTIPDTSHPRLRNMFEALGHGLDHGAQLAGGANLDDHWTQRRLYSGKVLKMTFIETTGEVQNTNNQDFPEDVIYNDLSASRYRDYTHALQGALTDDQDTPTFKNYTWDALVLQPYQSYLRASDYEAPNAEGYLGDITAINNFLLYASGDNPSSFPSARQFYIYSAWPQVKKIEDARIDTNADGYYSYSEFYDAPYDPGDGRDSGKSVPNRNYLQQLLDAVPGPGSNGSTPNLIRPLRLIPVGLVLREIDQRIINGTLTGIEDYFTRNAEYYHQARLDGFSDLEASGFVYLYTDPQNRETTYNKTAFEFVPQHGVKNFYCDTIHLNDQPHSGADAGTIGAYVAAATLTTCITLEKPHKLSPAEVAAIYEKFDPEADATLISELQDIIWNVITSPEPLTPGGPSIVSLTGAMERSDAQLAYEIFKTTHFNESEQNDFALSGSTSDFDGGGLSNAAEFYFQKDPRDPSDDQIWAQPVPQTASFQVTGLAQPAGGNIALESSTDLQNWMPQPLSMLPASFSQGMATYSLQLEDGDLQRFFRMKVTYPIDLPPSPLVNWGPSGEIVSSNQGLLRGFASSTLDLSTPASPNQGTSYYPQATDANPVFFASLTASHNPSNYRIKNESGDDTIHVLFDKAGQSADTLQSGTFLAVWTQDGAGFGFLNGAETGDVILASLRATVFGNNIPTASSSVRFVIRRQDQFLISQSMGTYSNTPQSFELLTGTGLLWFPYDPVNQGISFNEPAEGLQLSQIDQVTAVGLHISASTTFNYNNIFVSSFQATQFAR